ncbi:MAG: hypothetical protein WAW61_22400 [Methylococcaceae bacterium]
MIKSRALKFHHRQRIKNNRRHYFGRDLSNEPKYLGLVINTPTTCSCVTCCNWRKTEGITIQEKRQRDNFLDWVRE